MKKLLEKPALWRLGLTEPTVSFRQGSPPEACGDKLWAGIQVVGRRSGFRPEERRNDGKKLMQESIESPSFSEQLLMSY